MHDRNQPRWDDDAAQATNWPRMTNATSYGELPTSLYRVRPGDDLRSIAMKFYGRGDLWILICLANPGDIHGLRDLRPGKILRIPTLPVE